MAATAIGGNFLVHPDNIDFVILRPLVANVILYWRWRVWRVS